MTPDIQLRRHLDQTRRDVAAIERVGANALLPISRRLTSGGLAAWPRRFTYRDIQTEIERAMAEFAPLLEAAMVAAHLMGHKRAKLNAARYLAGKYKAASVFDAMLKLVGRHRLDTTPEEIDWLREFYAPAAFEVTKEAGSVLEEKAKLAVGDILEEGMHVKGGIARMREAFEAAGVTPSNPFLLENLVRTQIALAYSAGGSVSNEDPAIQEILEAYVWRTVGDYRVRPNHAAMEGATAAKDHPVWKLWHKPAGWSCVPADTCISTDKGMVPIIEVSVGDMVLTHRGRFRRVDAVYRRAGPKELVTVTADGASIRLTGNHRVFTKRGWVEASGLQLGDEVLQDRSAPFKSAPASGDVDDIRQVEFPTDGPVPCKIDGGALLLNFNPHPERGQVEVKPVTIGGEVELVFDPGKREQVCELLLVPRHRGPGVDVGGGVKEIFGIERLLSFLSNAWAIERRAYSQFLRHAPCPFRMLFAPEQAALCAGPYRDAMSFKYPAHGTVTDARGSENRFEVRLPGNVSGKHGRQPARPTFLNRLFCPEPIRQDPSGLPSHCDTPSKRDGIIVGVGWVKVKAISRIPWDDLVYNLSVEEDESYFAGGVAVHNCRCERIAIYSGEPWTEYLPDPLPQPDKGFEVDPAQMLLGDTRGFALGGPAGEARVPPV